MSQSKLEIRKIVKTIDIQLMNFLFCSIILERKFYKNDENLRVKQKIIN